MAHAREWGADDDTAHDATLVADELFANAFRHGSRPGGRVTVSLGLDGSELHVVVSDTRCGVPVRNTAAPMDESGHGLFLVDALAAKWGVDQHGATGKRTWAVLTLPSLRPVKAEHPGEDPQ